MYSGKPTVEHPNYLLLQAKRKIKHRAGLGDQNKLTWLESAIQSKTSGIRRSPPASGQL